MRLFHTTSTTPTTKERMKSNHEMPLAAPPPPSASLSSSSPPRPLRFPHNRNNKSTNTPMPTSPTTRTTTTAEQIYTVMTTTSTTAPTTTPTPSHNHRPFHHPKRTTTHYHHHQHHHHHTPHPITIPPRHRELSLTDSEISILDLGPSLLVLGEEAEGEGDGDANPRGDFRDLPGLRGVYAFESDRRPDWGYAWGKGEGEGARMERDTLVLRDSGREWKGKGRMDSVDAAAAAEREWGDEEDGEAGLGTHAHPLFSARSDGGEGGVGAVEPVQCWSAVAKPRGVGLRLGLIGLHRGGGLESGV
ncbi:hypothetical protein BO82DRAFT_413746 [Aspergillus uvarum CBS 121591]|uniref:Uncharacterized protein n=1 Tax=Aspergillus uvarum CBS 121591 TaxID=1448315 RepID=A0A319CBB9_9EURO|nr:hypothetical protein BO82DRAFT_413746 [Aspergillus uvarum CBS 121591]PYH82514.1 hypothetical protein BO82DRAFT_413746 [Aspergillus uvarum CBS 121591]